MITRDELLALGFEPADPRSADVDKYGQDWVHSTLKGHGIAVTLYSQAGKEDQWIVINEKAIIGVFKTAKDLLEVLAKINREVGYEEGVEATQTKIKTALGIF